MNASNDRIASLGAESVRVEVASFSKEVFNLVRETSKSEPIFLTASYGGSGPGTAYSRQLRNTVRKEEAEGIVKTEHFSQETLDLLRERTDGVLLITGRQGFGGNYSRLKIYLPLRGC